MKRLLLILTLALAGVAQADDGFRKGTDGYWYDSYNVAHTRAGYTAQCSRWVTRHYGCCETRRVLEYYPCTKYNYTPIIKIDPAQPIEKLAEQLTRMKSREVDAEIENRDRRAYVLAAKELISSYGFDQYKLQSYGNYLNYGEIPTQYPAASGDTQYGVFKQQSAFYGQQAVSLQPAVLDVNKMLVLENELEQAQETHYQQRQISRQEVNAELAAVGSQAAGVVAQTQASREMASALLQGFRELIEAVKPPAQATTESTHIYPVQPRPALTDGGGWEPRPATAFDFAGTLNRCTGCHGAHEKVATKIFPKGVTFNLTELTPDQRGRLATVVAIGKMPQTEEGAPDPLPEADRREWVTQMYSIR